PGLFHSGMRDRESLARVRCLPDEPVGEQVQWSVSSFGRIERFDRFPLTSRFLRWTPSNRNCPCGLASVLQPNRPRSAAIRRSAPPPSSRVRRGLGGALPPRGGAHG